MAHLPKGQGIFLPPFKAWLASNIPAVYDNTMSYYEELVALIKYLQDVVVPAVNDNAAAVTAISEAQETLQAYVDNYFDNLDIQEEINNKLDQMAEDGTLEEILSHYIDENVVRKDTYATSETGGAVKVGETLTIDSDGVLNEAPFLNYLPIETHVTRYQGTGGYSTVYYAIIDSDYKPDLTIANGTVNTVQLSGDNALDNKSTLTVNAGVFDSATGNTTGVIIKNGEILKVNDAMAGSREILYMTSDGKLHSVTDNTSADQLLTLGAVWAVQGWYPFVKDGQDLTSGRDPSDYQPRSVIGQDSAGRYIIMSNMGRSLEDAGMSAVDCLNFCTSVSFTPYFLYNLDGGGSVNFVDRGIRLNGLIDGTNRPVANFITWASETAKENGTFDVANAQYHKNVQEMRQSIPMNISSQVTANASNITLDTLSRVFLFGDLVIGWFKITTTGQIDAYSTLLNGLPSLPYGVSDIRVQFHKQSGTHELINLYISNGSLKVAGDNNMPAGTWFGNIVYSHNSGRTQSSTIE